MIIKAPKWRRWEGIVPVDAVVIGYDGYQKRVLVEYSKGDRKWISLKQFVELNPDVSVSVVVEKKGYEK